MPTPGTLLKAQLQPVTWDDQQQVQEAGDPIAVQFNPEIPQVAYSQPHRGRRPARRLGGAVRRLRHHQAVARAVVRRHRPGARPSRGRRRRRAPADQAGRRLHSPDPVRGGRQVRPAGVRFLWGSFMFEGIVDSINESLDFFSEAGKPLRAKISLSLSSQEIQFRLQRAGRRRERPGQRPRHDAADAGARRRQRAAGRRAPRAARTTGRRSPRPTTSTTRATCRPERRSTWRA